MKHLIKKLSKVAPSSTSSSSSYSLLRSDTLSSPRPHRKTHLSRHQRHRSSVPSGHVPVYVGEDMVRFIISTDLMHHPVFITLLNKSAQEYGYQQKGALRIPCNVLVFQSVVDALTCGRDLSSDLLDFINSVFTNNNNNNNDDLNLFF